MGHWAKIVRTALVYGVLGGIFSMLVILITFFVGQQPTRNGTTGFVTALLSFLIIGGAARSLASETRVVGVGWRMGTLAAGVSELVATMGSAIVFSFTPAASITLARLTRQQQAADPGTVIANLVLELAAVMLFGAMLGWLGAWSALSLGPPSKPRP